MNNRFHYNQKRRKRIFFFITVAALIGMIAFTSRNREMMTIGGNAIGTVTSPFTKIIYITTSKTSEWFKSVFGTKELRAEHKRLLEENKVLKDTIHKQEEVINKKDFLQEEYRLLQNTKLSLQKAYITGKDPSNLFIRFDIDKGSLAGVKADDVVVQGAMLEDKTIVESVVGRVMESGLNFSKVESIVDENSNIAFTLSSNGENGVIRGVAGKGLAGYMFNNDATVNVGDKVYTSGIGGIYPRNLYIGEVTKVEVSENDLIKRIEVKSPIDFSNLYRVLVLHTEEVKDE